MGKESARGSAHMNSFPLLSKKHLSYLMGPCDEWYWRSRSRVDYVRRLYKSWFTLFRFETTVQTEGQKHMCAEMTSQERAKCVKTIRL